MRARTMAPAQPSTPTTSHSLHAPPRIGASYKESPRWLGMLTLALVRYAHPRAG